MTLVRRTTGFPSLLDRFFEDNMMDWTNDNYSNTNTTLPRVNIRENKDVFTIEVAAPGMNKEDFKINYDNGKLSISSEMQKTENEGEKYTRREFSYESFKRTFDVAKEIIDGEKIAAKYTNGILYIELPKREEVKPKPAKEIAIA